MKDRLFKLLGIEPEEESMVSMLLMQSVFLGVYYGAFDISAHSLFLSVFDEKAMAKAYVLSGVVGILLTSIYTRMQAGIPFKTFAVINLTFVTIVTFLLWVAVLLFPGKIITFAVFVMMGPLNILAMLGFWGTTGRLFSLRQGKRLFGLVDAGLIIGIILSCYTIPVLLEFGFEPHYILLLSLGSGIAAAILQSVAGRKLKFSQAGGEGEKGSDSNLRLFRENKYFSTMGLFIALSVATAFFVQYSFMAVTRAQYPLEADMARFLGLFTGSMMIFTLLVKLLAFSYIIRNYGLKTCLAISPVIVGGFTVIAILLGTIMGFTPASSGFILFFLLLALSRMFSKALKDSIESPSFKVVYQTVDEKIRFGVQSTIDGTVNEISALFSGLLLAGLGALSFVKLIHFSWVLALMVGLWVYVAIRLYRGYRNTIRVSLEAVSEPNEISVKQSGEIPENRISAELLFTKNYHSIASGDLNRIMNSSNGYIPEKLVSHALRYNDFALLPALKAIADNKSTGETIRQNATGAIEKIESLFENLTSSGDRLLTISKLFSGNRQPQTSELLRLLRDNRIESKRYAILLIGKYRITDLAGEVCNCLNVKELRYDAFNIIRSFGSEAFEPLSRLFMSSSGNTELGLIIISLISISGGPAAPEFLFGRLWSNSRLIKEHAVRELLKSGYKAGAAETDKIHQAISDVMGLITWNLAAGITLEREKDNDLLEIVRRDTDRWFLLLFNMLSLAYDSSSIDKIRSNIESGTVGSINYALEMIDMVIDESIKGKLIYLIDSVTDEEKLRNLHQFYPRDILSYNYLIEDIINRDYNLAGLMLKAAALRRADILSSESLKESVTALLFSPEKILLEEAVIAYKRSGTEIPGGLFSRLPGLSVETVTGIMSNTYFIEGSEWNKSALLARLFPEIHDDDIVYLASRVTSTDNPSMFIPAEGNEYVAWCSNDGISYRQTRFITGKIGEVISYECRKGSAWYFLPVNVSAQMYLHSPEKAIKIIECLNKLNPSISD